MAQAVSVGVMPREFWQLHPAELEAALYGGFLRYEKDLSLHRWSMVTWSRLRSGHRVEMPRFSFERVEIDLQQIREDGKEAEQRWNKILKKWQPPKNS